MTNFQFCIVFSLGAIVGFIIAFILGIWEHDKTLQLVARLDPYGDRRRELARLDDAQDQEER